MNILFDNEIFSRQRYGGISRYFYELIYWLSKNDLININLYLGINNSAYDFESMKGSLETTGSKFRFADKLHPVLNPINKHLFEKYSQRKDFSLLHKTYYSDSGLKVNFPVVSTVHDMTHELMPDFFAKADNTALLKRLSVESSEAIVCVSETTKKDFLNYFNFDQNKVRVIYHGITIKDDPNSGRLIDQPYILYVGQRWGYKNFNSLLKAFSYSKSLSGNYRLVCFGGGKLNLSERILVKEAGLQDKVICISGSDSILVSMYKYAEVLVYTSFYEGFGFPPIEAMECGCPVLTSPAGSVEEVAGEAALYFDPADTEELACKLMNILNDTELRKNLVTKGREKALQFSWEKSSGEHFQFYKDILNV
ncbi:MAG: glycosyltransferase family 4 protein [Ignavibacteria bacterium]|nr:glycosyltransferase family 4 protein [Ignavibacteria bacterium]